MGARTRRRGPLLTHSGNLFTYTAAAAVDPTSGYGFAVLTNSAALHDDTYEILSGLVALSRGEDPEIPGGGRQWTEGVLALIAAGQDRVAQLEQEQALIAERVTLRERTRIAAEMHDSLGHELALIAVQAGALELSPDLPSTYQAAAQRLRESAVMATDRLRGTVAVLRDTGSAPNLPHDESVTALVERAEAAGMAVCLKRSEPWKPLPPLIDRAIYRVVQESLTNAARPAPGAPITVALGATPTAAIVTVANPATHSIADDALLRSVAFYPAATDPTAPRSRQPMRRGPSPRPAPATHATTSARIAGRPRRRAVAAHRMRATAPPAVDWRGCANRPGSWVGACRRGSRRGHSWCGRSSHWRRCSDDHPGAAR
ncbi:hypothetical protein BOX37_30415 [Nocardia mangyaensis]|uniref:histidine kinase n=1 Tax=Nocardia mangyaensis TaxID=2213200 RepID=A0A1J0VZP3_9NOCA|nr:histidine kinase [Nocardia mangyaensis]APE37531.1 hypothetical protein BOX37_30415 [Nocardia mangyaensis]